MIRHFRHQNHPIHRLVSSLLIMVLLGSEILTATSAHAQQRRGNAANQNSSDLTSPYNRLNALASSISALEQSPSFELAQSVVLPASLTQMHALKQQATGHDLARLNRYALYHHNRIVNAMAVAQQVRAITGDDNIRDSVFSSTLDIIPDVTPTTPHDNARRAVDDQGRTNASAFTLTSTRPQGYEADSVATMRVVNNVASLQTMAARQAMNGPRRNQLSAPAYKWRLVVDNEVALLKSYWLHMGRFVKAVPANMQAVQEVITRRVIMPQEFQEYYAALDQVRARLAADAQEGSLYRPGQYAHNRSVLTRRLESKRTELATLRSNAPAFTITNSQSYQLEQGGAWEAWNTLERIRNLFYRSSYSCALVIAPYLNPQCRDFDSNDQMLANLAGMNPQHAMCKTGGQIDFNSLYHGMLRENILSRIFPTQAGNLLNLFISHLSRNRPQPAESAAEGDGCTSASAPHGYNRKKFLLDFLESAYVSRFGENANTPIEDITPWELDGSATFERARTNALSEEPLLYSNALRPSYELTWDFRGSPANRGFEITNQHTLSALQEMAGTIRANMDDLGEIVFMRDSNHALAKLIDRNPVVAWRRAAKDWTTVHAMEQAYDSLRRHGISERNAEKRFFYGGMILMGVGIATGGAGLAIQGPVGALLITTGTAIGFSIGAYATYNSIQQAAEARASYNALRAQIFSRIGNNSAQRLRAERDLSRFYSAVAEAVVAGILTAVDIPIVMGGMRAISQVRQARTALRRAAEVGGVYSPSTIEYMGASFNIFSRAERNGAIATDELRQILAQNASRSTDDWLEDFTRRSSSRNRRGYPSPEEAIALGLRLNPNEALSSEFYSALSSGYKFSYTQRFTPGIGRFPTLVGKFARFYRNLGGITGRPLGRDWVTQLAERMGYSNFTARGPVLANADQVNRLFGAFLDDAVGANFTNPSMMNAIGTSIERTAWRTLTDADIRPGSVLRVFLDEVQAVSDAPFNIINRRRALESALTPSGITPEWEIIARSAVTGENGGFWNSLRRSIINRDGSLNRELLDARVQDWRRFWIATWAAIGAVATYDIVAFDVKFYTDYFDINQTLNGNPPIPEGVSALIQATDSAHHFSPQNLRANFSEEQLNVVEQEHILYQTAVRDAREVREDIAACRNGSRGDLNQPEEESCANPEGRRNKLRAFAEYLERVEDNIRTMESNSQRAAAPFANPTERYQAVARAARLD